MQDIADKHILAAHMYFRDHFHFGLKSH